MAGEMHIDFCMQDSYECHRNPMNNDTSMIFNESRNFNLDLALHF